MKLFKSYVFCVLVAISVSVKTFAVNINTFVTYSSNGIKEYEYWFDNNYAQKVTQVVAGSTSYSLNLNVSTSALNPGVHSFNIRYKDDFGNWSIVSSDLFYKPLSTVNQLGNLMTAYEYWFDNDYASRTSQAVTTSSVVMLNTSISTGTMHPGVHSFNIRYKDSFGNWSMVSSDLFYKPFPTANQSGSLITAYEYWFDNDYSSRTFQAVATSSVVMLSTSISTGTMHPGVHSFNIRYKDDFGNWSMVSSDLFYKPLPTANQSGSLMTAYEYWFDNDYSSRTSQAVTTSSVVMLNTSISTGTMHPGVHSFNIRYKDSFGNWSMVSSDLFYKPLPTANQSGNLMTAYEYWFDNDYSQKTYSSISSQSNIIINSSISTNNMNTGVHAFHVRFKDDYGNWSITQSSMFYKPHNELQLSNKVRAYRYWIDTLFSQQKHIELLVPIQPHLLSTSLTMTNTPKGKHVFNIQFMDSTKKWSVVQADTFIKASLPIASFSNNFSVFCDSGTVSFTNHSIDGDTYLWDFGDGNQSTLISPSHHYSSVGQYQVLLTIKDTITLQTSTFTVDILVSGKPVYSLGHDTLVCPNIGFELSATSSNSSVFLWNNGSVAPTLIPPTSGTYWCQVTNQFGCSYTDSINVSYKVLASASFSSSINGLVVGFNNLSTNASSYFWDFGDGFNSVLANPTHTFSLPGSYSVTLVAINDCGGDTLHEIINVVDVGVENIEVSKNVLVFPNPNRGFFEIVIKNSLGENTGIKLYSSDGKLIYNEVLLIESDLFSKRLEFEDISNGFYYLYINNSKGKIVRKIVIVK